MPISFNCSCGERLEVDDEFAGKQARCPYCEAVVLVPAAAPPPPPAKRAKLADDDTDDDRGAFAGSLNPLERGNRPSSRRRNDDDDEGDDRPSSRRRPAYDDDDEDDRPRRRRFQPPPYNPLNKQVVGGIVSIVIGVALTVVGLFFDRICFWPIIISVLGLIAVIRGLATGRDG